MFSFFNLYNVSFFKTVLEVKFEEVTFSIIVMLIWGL